MMQTRETRLLWRRRKRRFVMETLYCYSKLYTALIIVGCLTLLPQGITAQYNNNNNDELYIVKPTPALRLGKEELTTVLLVKNENHGRYINVRPEVGLLTSTARTFIQEGVTTEYATQVVGTTLDNGRVYAQYLKKSSRVLYDSDVAAQPSVVTSWVGSETLKSDAVYLPQSHNDLFNADQPDWRAIDDSLESDRRQKNNDFIGNTDYIAVSYKQSSLAANEKKGEDLRNFVQTSPSLSYSINSKIGHNFLPQLGVLEENARKVAANKVLPIGDLPTYTIKQNYEPNVAYAVSNDYNYDLENEDNSDDGFGRNPKRIYSNLISSQLKTEQALETRNLNSSPKPIIPISRNLATVTYYGFADFTTVVGDSVIVFSPSTSSANMNYNAHVTSIKGEATLGVGLPQEPSVSNVPITIAQDIIEPTMSQMSANIKVSLETVSPTLMGWEDLHEKTTSTFSAATIIQQNSIDVSETSVDLIQQTESESSSIYNSVTLSRPSDEDILRIYNSLANAGNDKSVILTNTTEATVIPSMKIEEVLTTIKEKMATSNIQTFGDETTKLETSNVQTFEEETTKLETSNVQTFGGATTIFFEEDPFDNFVEPAKTLSSLEAKSTSTAEIVSKVSIDINTIKMDNKSLNPDEVIHTEEKFNKIDEMTNNLVLPTSEINLVSDLNNIISTSQIENQQSVQEIMKSSTQDIKTTNNILPNVLIKEIDPNKDDVPKDCISTSQVFLTQEPKTVKQLATVVITDGLELKTEIKEEIVPTFEIKEATKYYCIQASKIEIKQLENTLEPTTVSVLSQLNHIENTLEHSTESEEGEFDVTTPNLIQNNEENDKTEVKSIEVSTEQNMAAENNIERINEEDTKQSSTESIDNDEEEQQEEEEEVASGVTDEDDDEDEEDEEIELIYKTLYTTYTYLTTFFHDDATSISSHTEIVTNIMTSTLGINSSRESTTTNPNYNEINPSTVSETNFLIETTKRFEVPSEVDSLIRTDEDDDDNDKNEAVSHNIDHSNISSEALATFYTTYTYYTTIFAEGETEIMSHTEIITNIKKSSTSAALMETDMIMPTVSLQQNDISSSASTSLAATTTNSMEGDAAIPNIPDLGDLSAITLITDVRSSSSSGDKQIISNKFENNNVQLHSVYEDQLSSESNTDVDEIIPSATLLLQTSFTTFTYYTTMYSGDKTNVVSRLETMTNTVTETLQPSKTISLEENSIPITYFTTFTYWTKLAKDGQITTLSREETISNIVLPTPIQKETQTQFENPVTNQLEKISVENQQEEETTVASVNEENSLKIANEENENKLVNLQTQELKIINEKSLENPQLKTNILEPTTYYTTYTYYTTSYENDKTSTVSRFETITNIVTPTVAITNNSLGENTQNPVIVEVAPSSTSINNQNNKPHSPSTDLILYDFKKIIDADGVSTIFFTTEIKPTINSDGLLSQVISSSSSLLINEEKRSIQATASLEITPTSIDSAGVKGNLPKQYKTGLVRLIEGTRIGNGTTTLYQSKVIGTVIDQRYAQIIESTSSFIFENTNSASVNLELNTDIMPTLSSDISNIQTTQEASIYNINSANVQGSITEQNSEIIAKQEIEVEQEHEQEEDNLAKTDEKLRLPFQTKKSQYASAVKPFSNRTRPQFAGKKNSSATIITRSDFTPTITATPALKTINRFSSTRRGGLGGSSIGNSLALNTPSRRFGRPSKSAAAGLSSAGFSASSSRNRFASSSNARGSFASSSRRVGASAAIRPSFSRPSLFSSGFPGNSRLRVRPSASLDFGDLSSSSVDVTTSNPQNSQEDNTEDSVDDQEEQEEENTTTENSRRQNPLLRLRRPLNRPQGFTPARAQSNNPNNPVTIRRNPFINNSRSATTTTTTTTAKPKPRTFQPPLITQNRIRPTNSLFPPRNIFGLQKPKTNTEETKDLSEEDTNENNDDSDYEDEDEEELEGDDDDENSRRRRSNNKRSKREADSSQQNRSNFRNRFRRPKLASSSQQHEASSSHEEETNETKEAVKSGPSSTTPHRPRSRFGARSSTTTATTSESTTTNHKAIRPTRPTHNNGSRPQFTLRDKDSSSTSTTQKGLTTNKRPAFRRPQPAGGGSVSNRRLSSSTAPSNKRRLKSFTNNDATTTSRNTVNGRIRSPSSTVSGRGRPTTGTSRESNTGGGRNRARNNHNYNNSNDPVVIDNSGTITVTHVIPAEVTIPVVNGKVTEYKQVVTAKTSTEVLGPQQYTTTLGINGMTQLALTREDSSVNYNGATEVTQYILHETPTTTITFTPTTIRGRKTSFSHVLPSTVYSVEQVISTLQPQLSANAPLANILLSQLLLGNVGLPAAGNPLLGALGGALTQPGVGLGTAIGAPAQPATPVTEYRTHASTYVTTVFEGQSTVLPVTFQGKKILTTIFDTTAQTITATEFITDTIVTTPTVAVQPQPVVNSLLLQQLLLQQHLQQQQQQQLQQPTPDPSFPLNAILNSVPPQFLLGGDNLQELEASNNIRGSGQGDLNEDEDFAVGSSVDLDDISLQAQVQSHKTGRKKSRKSAKNHKRKQINADFQQTPESSVITLYVSGRRPGEFSTVLSTVQVRPDSTVYKRHVHTIDSETDYLNEGSEIVNEYLVQPPEIVLLDDKDNKNEISYAPTQSLESIVGDVSSWYNSQNTASTKKTSNPDLQYTIDNMVQKKYSLHDNPESSDISFNTKHFFV